MNEFFLKKLSPRAFYCVIVNVDFVNDVFSFDVDFVNVVVVVHAVGVLIWLLLSVWSLF